jgi:branched-chain amino acid transport system substrate-binding protein
MAKQIVLIVAVAMVVATAKIAPAQVKIAVGGPMSGNSAAFGAQLKNGVEQAVADINNENGILGQKLTLSVGDDRGDPRDGVVVANTFVADGVKFVVGHFNSGVAIPASDIYDQNGLLMVTASATTPAITDRHLSNVFRVCGRDDKQGAVAGTIIARRFAGKRVAILHDRTTYGYGLAEETRKAMNAKGIREVFFDGVDRDASTIVASVSKMVLLHPDLVYWGGLHHAGAGLLREMRRQGMTATLMGGDGLSDSEFAALAGTSVEGTLMTASPDPRTNAANEDLVKTFRETRNFEPQGYTLYGYAAVQVIKQASELAKSADPLVVAKVMHSGKAFSSVLGEVSFNLKGDVSGYTIAGKRKETYVLYVWKKGPGGEYTYSESN